MSKTSNNIIANFVGRFWGILSSLLFIPLYIQFLGIESYAIITFTHVIAGVVVIIDSGLSPTLLREFSSSVNSTAKKKRILKTLETCYLIITFVVILIIILSSDFLAKKWLNLSVVDPQKVAYYLKIIGIGISFQLLSNFYLSGLLGLEKQVNANIYQSFYGLIRNGGVIIPLIFWPSLELFFIWQTIASILFVIVLRVNLIHSLSKEIKFFQAPKIDTRIIKQIWRFAGGMFLISVVASVNTQMDKLAISKILNIEILGYYIIAMTLAQGLLIMINPISVALLPRFTSLYSGEKFTDAEQLFHKTFLLVSIIIFSIAANLILNAKDIIWIWTGNIELATKAHIFVPYLVGGMVMQCLQIMPYNIAVANGYTRLNNYLGLISIIIALPGYWIMTKHYGAVGAAITWFSVQFMITPIFLYYINKFFLKRTRIWKHHIKEILIPAIIAFLLAWGFSNLNHLFHENKIFLLAWIGTAVMVTLLINTIFLIPARERSNYFYTLLPFFRKGKY